MTGFDYAVLIVIGLSLLIGVLRGAVKEVLSLFGWVAAFLVANTFAGQLAPALSPLIINPALQTVAVYAALFIVTLFLVMLLKIAMSELIKTLGLGALDRFLGLFVGFARGALITLIGVLVAGMTALPREPFWRQAVSSPWFETLAVAVKPSLPEEIARRINFHPPMKA
jgi:membrane protein required for colicin V production